MVVSLWPPCWGLLLEELSMRKPVLVFLRLLITAPHMNFSKLFIFLTSPYGAGTCLSWSVLKKCKSEPELLLVCIHGRPSSNNAWFLLFHFFFFFFAGWAPLMQLSATCYKSSHQLENKMLINIIGPKRGDVLKVGVLQLMEHLSARRERIWPKKKREN